MRLNRATTIRATILIAAHRPTHSLPSTSKATTIQTSSMELNNKAMGLRSMANPEHQVFQLKAIEVLVPLLLGELAARS